MVREAPAGIWLSQIEKPLQNVMHLKAATIFALLKAMWQRMNVRRQ